MKVSMIMWEVMVLDVLVNFGRLLFRIMIWVGRCLVYRFLFFWFMLRLFLFVMDSSCLIIVLDLFWGIWVFLMMVSDLLIRVDILKFVVMFDSVGLVMCVLFMSVVSIRVMVFFLEWCVLIRSSNF